MQAVPRPLRPTRWLPAAVLGGVVLASAGCANFWDEVTSRDFKVANLYTTPDPLVTIRDSSDAAQRARAFALLKEPHRNGGSPQDQETYLTLLATAARSDREPLCRLSAIGALGRFQDPRAARALEEAFLQQNKLPFTQEFNNTIRTQTLVALETVGDPGSLPFLVRLARQPGPALEAGLADRQQTQDEKLIAIRALGKFKSGETLETLVHVMKTEKDVAVRDQAHDSLELVTGKRLPTDPAYWQQQADALALEPAPVAENGLLQRVTGWMQPSR